MSIAYPRAVPCGDSGVSIEFGDRIDEQINERVIALDLELAKAALAGVIETVPTYRALMIHYDPVVTSFDNIRDEALALARIGDKRARRGRVLRIPVCYEASCGLDLPEVASRLGLAIDEVIARHTAPLYRVYMLGFQPGFAYLGGLDPVLSSLPRRMQPRFGARAGTISIAAGQCAVHSVDGPSGWHWIGRTPAQTYVAGEPPRFRIEPGDRIRFVPVDVGAWHGLARAAAAGIDLVEVES